MTRQPGLFDAMPDVDPPPPDQAARDFAVQPSHHVVLEASAGTGKTRVLVERYVRLIQAGVDPRHILAVTFTRKAAAEMRDRVVAELSRRAARGELAPEVWRALRDRISDIQVSTIDAFCFGLLREFPLEADVDPAFDIADETEMARFANEALDLTFRAARALIVDDEPVRLLFARVKGPILREALGTLLDRRQVALPAVARFVRSRATCPTAAAAGEAFVSRMRDRLRGAPDRAALLEDGPRAAPEFGWLNADLAGIERFPSSDPVRVQALRRRLERHFLTKDGKPRQRLAQTLTPDLFSSADARKRHAQAVQRLAPAVLEAMEALDADLNGLLARGLLRVLAIAVDCYERLLEEHAVLDFAGMLARSVALLEQQEEFARSRLKLQSRFHHLLVDEFQDTSRLQWRLVELLISAWGEGEGGADAPTSVFIVGDRKQSIYRFRHAEATLLDEAARLIAALRPGLAVRQAIAHSFRAVPELLSAVNAVSEAMQIESDLLDRFQYRETDRFPAPPVRDGALRDGEPVIGLIAQPTTEAAAAAVASEVARLLGTATVRTRDGAPRRARPEDVAIVFRARAGHQYFEEALEARGIRTYVYKGLGFFDAPEVQDLQALLRYLAQPVSDLRAGEFLRSRLVRLSDAGLASLAPGLAQALRAPDFDIDGCGLEALDRALLDRARQSLARWLPLADRLAPGELIDRVLGDSAFVYEMRGRRLDQARENLKKVRALVRRIESRGYATIGRLADYFETLRAGEESNALVAATDCVNLMTIHAAKGLEFPIVFVVNLQVPGRGKTGGFSVIEGGPAGEPEVAFTSTDATRREELREQEELKRLLYVAMTRARDRLYLSVEVDSQHRPRRPARSLAALLPERLLAAFGEAAITGHDRVDWVSPSGSFTCRVCRPTPMPESLGAEASVTAVELVDVRPVAFEARSAVAVTAPTPVAVAPAAGVAASREGAVERTIGTLVHRLFQRQASPHQALEALATTASRLAKTEELVDVDDPEALTRRVAAIYAALCGQGEAQALLASGRAHFEVPLSVLPSDQASPVVRGQIDCLIEHPDGSLTVLEVKTGRPRPEHEQQVGVYRAALQDIWPGRAVHVRILYP